MTRLGVRTRRATTLAALALFAWACGTGRARPGTPGSDGRECTLVPAPAAGAESAAAVLTWSVDPANIARPSNPAERFVFAHLYETLLRVDCLGRLSPGLARSWTPVPSSTRWSFVLRDGARFTSGDRATTADVIDSWRGAGADPTGPLARRLAESARVVDDSTLEVECWNAAIVSREPAGGANRQPRCASLVSLGDPALAVVRHGPPGQWPDGTGAYRVGDMTPARSRSGAPRGATLVLQPAGGSSGPRLTIHSVNASEARDLIDGGVDLLLTDDPALVAYASAQPEMSPLSLGWDRTWVVLTPRQATNGRPALEPDSVAALTLAFRAALARDAVRAEARAAEGPYWWNDLRGCSPLTAPRRGSPTARVGSRVAFRRDEPIARAIAERIVALASGAGPQDTALVLLAPEAIAAGTRLTTVALSPDDFDASLREGSELAYVVALPRRSLAPCQEAERLVLAAPWATVHPAAVGLSSAITPLVDTRLMGVVRRDRLGLTVTGDSTVTVSTHAPTAGGPPR